VLNKLIRDKHHPDVVKAARKQMEAEQMEAAKNQSADGAQKPSWISLDPQFLDIFVRDASKSIAMLDAISEKHGAYNNEDDMRAYIINVHGIKSALSNIGQAELSDFALKLEQAGRKGNTDVISSKTPAFLNSLRALLEEIAPKKDRGDKAVDGDPAILREKLFEIKAACEAYNKRPAKDLITELKKKTWPKQAGELLEAIEEHLLHSDFDEIVSIVDKFIETR
jgi:HPt (histidine-containing phosphotransfer) domain-containing protein